MSIVGGSSPHMPILHGISLAPLVVVVLVCVVVEVRAMGIDMMMDFCAASLFFDRSIDVSPASHLRMVESIIVSKLRPNR